MIYLWLVSYFEGLHKQDGMALKQLPELRIFLEDSYIESIELCLFRSQLHLVLKIARQGEVIRCQYTEWEGWDEQHFPHKVIGWHDFPKGSFEITKSMLCDAVTEAVLRAGDIDGGGTGGKDGGGIDTGGLEG